MVLLVPFILLSHKTQLTTNFEFWVEFFCLPTCFHVRIPKNRVCLSVRTMTSLNYGRVFCLESQKIDGSYVSTIQLFLFEMSRHTTI